MLFRWENILITCFLEDGKEEVVSRITRYKSYKLFSMEFIIQKVFKKKTVNIQELKYIIITEIRRIEQAVKLQNVLRSFNDRIVCCFKVDRY